VFVHAAAAADNSRRAFYKEFRKVVEASDVVIQVKATHTGLERLNLPNMVVSLRQQQQQQQQQQR
jgi:hypothetical protein